MPEGVTQVAQRLGVAGRFIPPVTVPTGHLCNTHTSQSVQQQQQGAGYTQPAAALGRGGRRENTLPRPTNKYHMS